MPQLTTPRENVIYICPHCDDEIDSLNYYVDTRENGNCDIVREPVYDFNNQTGLSDFTGEFRTETENHDSEENEWRGDIEYCCPNCGDSLSLRDIIIQPINQTTQQMPPEENNEEDAVESTTNIQHNSREVGGNPRRLNEVQAFNCPECNHLIMYSPAISRIHEETEEEIVICPQCGTEINVLSALRTFQAQRP